MRNSTNILATIALGAVLAIGSASASMARDGGGFGGDHGGSASPFFMNHGGGYGGGGFGYHGFDGRHHFGGFRGRHDHGGAFFGFAPFWPDQYWAYDDGGAAYCWPVRGRHGVRYYCP